MMLNNNKCQTDSALGGLEALQKIKNRLELCLEQDSPKNMYRLILLDYSMPEMDGP